MPFVDKIVSELNTVLSGELNNNAALSNHYLYGIAEPSQTNDTEGRTMIQPCVINLDGEATPVTYDDSYALVGFHSITQEVIGNIGLMSFGNKLQDYVSSSSDMELVIVAHRTKVKMSPRILAGQVFSMFPSGQITITDTSNNKVGTAVLSVTGINYDSLSIFGRYYRNAEYFISESLTMIAIRYNLESRFRKECFNTCIC